MLGNRIAALRKSRGLSQAELARRLQISASALGMYEQGRREPSLDMVVALASELEVTTDYLLTGIPTEHGDANAWTKSVLAAVERNAQRRDSFSREELTAFFAAILSEP